MASIDIQRTIELEILEKNNFVNRNETYSSGREKLDDFVPWMFHPVLVIFGLSANLIVATIIVGNRSMHVAANCYVFSIIFADFVVLSDVLLNVFRRWFKLSFQFDGSYIDCVTLEATVLTIVIFAIERYVSLCLRKSELFKFSDGIKSVLVIWSMAATLPAMELNLNLHFLPDDQALIFLVSTTIFILLPTLVIITLTTFILIDYRNFENNSIQDFTKVFVALTLVFYVSMAPYRIVSLVRFMVPTLCCSQTILNSSYLIVELSAAVNPILYGFVSSHFRTAFKETLQSFCSNNQLPGDQNL